MVRVVVYDTFNSLYCIKINFHESVNLKGVIRNKLNHMNWP